MLDELRLTLSSSSGALNYEMPVGQFHRRSVSVSRVIETLKPAAGTVDNGWRIGLDAEEWAALVAELERPARADSKLARALNEPITRD